MKKICFISDRNIVMKKICNFLAENDLKIHIICRHNYGLEENKFHENIVFHQLTSQTLLKKFFEINKIINLVQPDIIHLHQIAKDSIIPIFKFKRKYKYFITIWGSDINIFSKNIVNRICQNFALLFCDKIQILSTYFERKLRKKFMGLKSDRFVLFPWGIDFDFFHNCSEQEKNILRLKYEIKKDDFVILSFRNFHNLYNQETLVKAMLLVLKKYPNSRFIFIRGNGEKEYIKKIQNLVKEQNVSDNFIFIDEYIDQAYLKVFINISHISINIPFADGLPASLLEIMATGSIPIVSDLINYRSLIQDKKNGFYLKNLQDHNELSSLIIKTLDNYQELSKKFSKVNNEYIQKNQNWTRQSVKLLDFYNP